MSISARQSDVLVRRIGPLDRIKIKSVVYHRAEPMLNGYCLIRKDDGEPEVFTHEDIERFHSQDQLIIDPEYFRFRHRFEGDPRYVDVTSIDVLPPPKRADVRRKLAIVREIETQVALGRRILSEEALQPLIDAMFDEGTPFRKELEALAKLRSKKEAVKLAKASNAEVGRQIDVDKEDRFKKPPSARSALKWYRRYRAAGRNVMVLAGNYSTVGAKRIVLPPRVQQHVGDALEVREFSGTLEARYKSATLAIAAENREIEQDNERRAQAGEEPAELLTIPSFHIFRREARKRSAFENMICAKGLPAATRAFTALGAGLDIRSIGERVEMDCWQCNLKTILEEAGLFDLLGPAAKRAAERRKVWLVYAIDCGSRLILGIAFSLSSNSDAVLNARAQIGLDKTDIARSAGCRSPWSQRTGVQLLVADNGTEFTATPVLAAEAALGESAKSSAPAAMPQMKGTCERFFARCAKRFQGTPGWTEFRQRLNKDFSPDKHAQLVLDELMPLMIRDTVDVYHNVGHRGLGGMCPAQAWDILYEKRNVHPIASPSRRRVAFGIAMERVAGRHGVTVLGVDYQSDAIQEVFRARGNIKVQVFIEPRDLGAVSVLIDTEFHVARPRRNIHLQGISVDALLAARRALRARYEPELKLREAIVNEALAAAQALFARTAYRATIVLEPITAERIDAEERKLGIALQIEEDESSEPGAEDRTFGLPLESFPVGAASASTPVPTKSVAPRAARTATRFGKGTK